MTATEILLNIYIGIMAGATLAFTLAIVYRIFSK